MKKAMMKMNFQWLRTCAEIPTFVLFISLAITETVTYNFVMYRTCYVDMGYNQTDCERLGTGDSDKYLAELEGTVQPRASIILMVQEILPQAAPAILCLFLGPWSDKHGRKPVLIFTLIGFCLGALMFLIVVLIESLSAWWTIGASLMIALFGGVSSFMIAIICYVSDISSQKNRGMRMGIFEGLMATGMLIGTFSSSYIFNSGGYVSVCIIMLTATLLALFYHSFVMVESLQLVEKKEIGGKLNIFSRKNFNDMLKTTFKSRPNHVRTVLILTVVMSIILKFLTHSDASIFYMFLRKTLNWDMEKYTVYKTIRELFRILATIGGISLLHRFMRIREIPLIVLGAAVTFISMLLQAVANEDWHIFLAGVLRALSGLLSPMSRSLLSKLVTQEETGKVFALCVAIESLSLLAGMPLYTYVYNKTLNTYPGAFNLLTAGLYLLLIILALAILLVQKLLQKEDVFIMQERRYSINEKVKIDE